MWAEPGKGELFSVFVAEVLREFGFKLAIIGVDRGPQCGFSRTAIIKALKDSLNVAHTVSVIDVRNRSQQFRISQVSFSAGESHETAFQDIQWNIALSFEQAG